MPESEEQPFENTVAELAREFVYDPQKPDESEGYTTGNHSTADEIQEQIRLHMDSVRSSTPDAAMQMQELVSAVTEDFDSLLILSAASNPVIKEAGLSDEQVREALFSGAERTIAERTAAAQGTLGRRRLQPPPGTLNPEKSAKEIASLRQFQQKLRARGGGASDPGTRV
jgi:hypothetical protein